ncbi:hypothetical protein NDU88_000665 [Pleurodeles waltl]|uniref:Uncharacterized protein n=1 Tax=Pleurodeles waltl TaxID=8319 RepID=A0AAV7LVI2_PLEWA|nr:hypothetical protein NDU88_000665 [Pleurodeles waltl]
MAGDAGRFIKPAQIASDSGIQAAFHLGDNNNGDGEVTFRSGTKYCNQGPWEERAADACASAAVTDSMSAAVPATSTALVIVVLKRKDLTGNLPLRKAEARHCNVACKSIALSPSPPRTVCARSGLLRSICLTRLDAYTYLGGLSLNISSTHGCVSASRQAVRSNTALRKAEARHCNIACKSIALSPSPPRTVCARSGLLRSIRLTRLDAYTYLGGLSLNISSTHGCVSASRQAVRSNTALRKAEARHCNIACKSIALSPSPPRTVCARSGLLRSIRLTRLDAYTYLGGLSLNISSTHGCVSASRQAVRSNTALVIVKTQLDLNTIGSLILLLERKSAGTQGHVILTTRHESMRSMHVTCMVPWTMERSTMGGAEEGKRVDSAAGTHQQAQKHPLDTAQKKAKRFFNETRGAFLKTTALGGHFKKNFYKFSQTSTVCS